MTPIDVVVVALLATGSGLMLLAALGILRMPDVYMRMSSASKASTLGSALVVAAVATHFGTVAVATRAVAIVAFLVLTIPVASHAIGRAAYLHGVALWPPTRRDDLQGRYDVRTHELSAARDPEE
jgi:multicomponent Na+:H+ antiporter subunit G